MRVKFTSFDSIINQAWQTASAKMYQGAQGQPSGDTFTDGQQAQGGQQAQPDPNDTLSC